MKLSRKMAMRIHFVLDQLLPPVIRDARWFMSIPMRMLYGKKSRIFQEFKAKACKMTEEEYCQAYIEVSPVLMERESDLNDKCVAAILEHIVGRTVIDVGGGNCFLAEKIDDKLKVTIADIAINKPKENTGNITFVNAFIEKLPFEDKSFDTVICAHTLEHIAHINRAIDELRRITRQRLIIVVPAQRPYKYTFDLHLQFFPYIHSFQMLMGNQGDRASCEIKGGDIFYCEDMDSGLTENNLPPLTGQV